MLTSFSQRNSCSAEIKLVLNEKGLPMTYKIGTIGEFKKWTMQVVTDPAAAANTPNRWFDSEETAAKALEKAGRDDPFSPASMAPTKPS